jgi:hypothetical protein
MNVLKVLQVSHREDGDYTGTYYHGRGSIFWYISIENDKKNLMDNTITFVSSFSEVVKKSVRNDMLLFSGKTSRTLESWRLGINSKGADF